MINTFLWSTLSAAEGKLNCLKSTFTPPPHLLVYEQWIEGDSRQPGGFCPRPQWPEHHRWTTRVTKPCPEWRRCQVCTKIVVRVHPKWDPILFIVHLFWPGQKSCTILGGRCHLRRSYTECPLVTRGYQIMWLSLPIMERCPSRGKTQSRAP